MRKSISLVTILLATATALASSHSLPSGATGITVIDGSWGNTILECNLAAFDSELLSIAGDDYHAITLMDAPRLELAGAPALPHLAASIVIPDQGGTSLEILAGEYTDFPGLTPEPSKGTITRNIDPATVPYTFGAAYRDQVFPVVIAQLDDPYILRDFRGQVVHFQPFQWLPQSNTLRVYHHIQVRISNDSRSGLNEILRTQLPTAVDAEFHQIYRRHFLNFDAAERYTPLDEQGNLLIITNDAFYNTMLPFYEWKLQKGIPTEMVNLSSIGSTSSQVQAYVQTYYNTNGLTFLLLVGDAADVPTPYAAGGSSDPTYSLIVGGDTYPDIFVGRFSGETPSQIATMVERSVEYERDAASSTWYHKGTGIASNQGPGDDGEYDNEHMDVIRVDLLGYTYTQVDQIYDPSGTATQVSNALNNGRSIINYCGHGSTTSWSTTGFSNSHINSLVNNNMLPFIQSVACVNGQFDGYTCFAEAWLRATNGGQPTGAIAMYASSINQSWNSPMCGQDEMIDLLTQDEKRTYGGITYNGSMQMMDEYGSDGQNMFKTWHIFGDPSIELRTDSPAAMTLSHAGSMLSTATTYDVTAVGVANALCALYYDGTLYGYDYTNGGGNATIVLTATPPVGATLTLTVTAYNRLTYQGGVSVIPPAGPYVAYYDHTVNDANGQLNPGDTPYLTIDVLNSGVETAYDVTVTLATSDSYVTVTDASEYYGDIAAGNIGSVPNGFRIAANASLPDGHAVLFTLTASTPTREVWESSFTIIAYAPPVIEVSPAAFNVILDPGASTTEPLYINNLGWSNLTYSVQLSTDSRETRVPEITLAKGEPDPRTGVAPRDQGGPDSYGHFWIDSDELGGPAYSWVEISGVGTSPGSSDDANYGPFSLGFNFDYYGVTYNAVRICTNGFLSFTATSSPYTNQGIPNSGDPNALLAPFWDDLNPSAGGTIYYYADTANDRFIVEWYGVHHYPSGSPETFQVILNADGSILYQYQTVSLNNSCTVGIENQSGTDGLQIAFNTNYLHSGLAILITDNLADPWLDISPTSGTVTPGGSDVLTVTFDAGELEVGTYTGSITVNSNDPGNGTVVVPVTLEVGGTPLNPVDDLTISADLDFVTLTWSAVTGATGYKLYVAGEPYGTYSYMGTTTSTSWTMLRDADKKFYYVTAIN